MSRALNYIHILLLVFSIESVQAVPKNVEIWFLSIDKTSDLRHLLNQKNENKLLVQSNLQCQQMGDYCFDPQVGLYKKEDKSDELEKIDLSVVDKKEEYEFIDPHQGAQREFIECDKNSRFFDVFCGKAKKSVIGKNVKLEVWVDVSSTMKQVDFEGFEKQCQRERFLRKLGDACRASDGLKLYQFEEYRKEVGMIDRVCLSSGLNNMKNIINDLKASRAESVLIITDIFEAQEKFIDAVEAMGVTNIVGVNKPFYAKDMNERIKTMAKKCK